MWLLDVNMPVSVVEFLRESGIDACHASSRGWSELVNGALVETSLAGGFRCVLTRDRLFGQAASRALKRFPEFAVVLITISQVRGPEFIRLFERRGV